MSASLRIVPRTKKHSITNDILVLLTERQQKGPAEPGLDAFIPKLTDVAATLGAHVTGRLLADATRETQLARADETDVEVDTWYRHIEGFLSVEANRRSGPNVVAARGLCKAACPDGLAHINDRIVDQNAHCAETLAVLKDPANAEVIAAIKLPVFYIEELEAALKASDSAMADVIAARGDKATHIDLGRDTEATWIDLMVRLRSYIDSRAARTDAVLIAEGKALLKPLLDVMQKQKTDAAARATRKKKGGAEGAPKKVAEGAPTKVAEGAPTKDADDAQKPADTQAAPTSEARP